ncbi:hypothetical protein Tsubulata_024227 [Turnera subulata]|uniref:RING-CH-type domain-containing protein n=1 Tax=Turnera subulata TaxID=218843 RepID=A0A9Q0J5M1_9ROSI|nr:hypothetical protein Tsubulata_024227 [Turnera subulata]
MGDHFVLLVDRLITESTLEAAIESRNRSMQATASAVDDTEVEKSSQKVDFGDISTPRKIVECRICQDEDEDSNMEIPCSCCGSLKYAHRRCVQRWCNEKGNTICEICHQQFKPGYTAPPPLFQIGRIPLSFRGNWETSRRDVHGPRFIMVSTERSFLNNDYEEYSASTTRNSIYCRLVAIIVNLLTSLSRFLVNFRLRISQFMVLLVLRHTLPLILNGNYNISFPLFMLLFLRTAGIILPIYFMMKAITALQRRRLQHEAPNPSFSLSSEEAENSTLQPQPHIINVL